jgi:hypothetical protein
VIIDISDETILGNAEALGQHISLIIPKERLEEETFVIGEFRKGNKVGRYCY